MNLSKITAKKIEEYQTYLERLELSKSTINRRLSALRKFCNWAGKEGYLEKNPFAEVHLRGVSLRTFGVPLHLGGVGKRLSNAYEIYHSISITSYLHYAVLIIFCVALGMGLYNQLTGPKAGPAGAYPTALTPPNRYLSFQGRLTDSSNNPIHIPTNFVFKLWNHVTNSTEVACDGGGDENCLWSSGNCNITPDQDGIFSVLLGLDCGLEIDDSVFSENAGVWLQITVGTGGGAQTLSPRIQVATVAYALNAETLQGYPPGTAASNIPYINSDGDVIIAAASPVIQATSGTFSIEGQTGVTIQAATGQNGNINLSPKGTGRVIATFQASTGNLLDIQGGANIGGVGGKEANNIIYGYAGSGGSTNLNLLKLEAGATPDAKFTVDASGNASMAGSLKIETINSVSDNNIVLTSDSGTVKYIDTSGWDKTASDDVAGSGTTNYIPKWQNSNTLTNSIIYETGGQIGIGTTNPGQKLEVAGNLLVTGANSAFGTGSSIDTSRIVTINGSLTGTGPTGLRVAPTLTLSSVGTALGVGIQPTVNIGSASDNDVYGLLISSMGLSGSGGTIGNLYGLRIAAQSVPVTTTNAYALYLDAPTAGTNKYAVYSASGKNYFSGNVGIGTTNPGYKLDVAGNVNIGGTGTIGNIPLVSDNNRVLTSSGAGSGIIQYIDTSNWDKSSADDYVSWLLAGDSGTPQTIGTGNTASFVGGIGIGTTSSATDTLTINVNQGYNFAWTGNQSWAGGADFNGNVSIADTDVVLDGTSTNLNLTGNFSINSDDLFVKKSTGYIGIGTTAPEQDLTVANNILLGITDGTRYVYFDNGTANNAGIRYDSSTDKMQFSHDGSSWTDMGAGGVTGSGNTNYIPKWSSSTALTDSVIYETGSNLGVGTTAPGSYKLNVAGNTYIDGTLTTTGAITAPTSSNTINSLVINAGAVSGVTTLSMSNQLTNSYANTAAINLTGAGAGITFGSSGPYQIITGGTTNLALMPGGNVGIGTTNPGYKLDVAGNVNIGGTGTIGNISLVSDNNRVLTSSGAGSGTVQYINTSSWDKDSSNDYGAWLLAGDSGTPQNIGAGDTASIVGGTNITTTAGATDKVTVSTVANPIFSTSVSSPIFQGNSAAVTFGNASYATTIAGSSTLTINPTSWTVAPTISGVVTMTLGFNSNAASTVTSLTIDGAAGAGDLTISSGETSFTSPATTADANVIVANSLTSGGALDISSTATNFSGSLIDVTLSGSNANNTGSLLTLTNSGSLNTNTSFYLKHYAAGTNNLAMRVDDASGDTTPFVIDGGGNVGIGTTSPGQKLDVVGNVQFSQALMPGSSAGSSGQFLISQGANVAPIWTSTVPATSLKWNALTNPDGNLPLNMGGYSTNFTWTGGGKFAWDTNGNVGIGNTTPGTTLDVTGTGRFSSTLTASNGLTLTTGALNLTGTSGALTLSGLSASSINTGANDITFTSGHFNTTATGINSTAIGATTPSTGAFTTLTSSGNSTIGTGASTTNTFGAGSATINTIGSLGGASSLALQAGTGNFTLNGVAGTTYTLGASTTTGTFAIGGTAQTGLITLGKSSGTNIVEIGAGEGATTVNIAGGATNAKTVNIGTGAAMANNISLGGTGANVIAIGNTQTAGSIAMGAAMTTGTIGIGGTGLQTGTISIGTGTGAQAINLGTGGTGAKTVTVGGLDSTSSLALNSGTGAINIGTAIAKTITLGNATTTTALALNSGTGDITLTSTDQVKLNSSKTAGGTTTEAFSVKSTIDLGVADEVLQIGDSALDMLTVLGSGNVGIGTTAPDSKLHIVGGDAYIAPDSGYTFNNPSGNEDLYVYGNLEVDGTIYGAGGSLVSGTGTAGQATFWTGSSSIGGDNAFWWDNSSKRLGIGTTGPTQKLDVAGNARLSSSGATYLQISSTNAGGDPYIHFTQPPDGQNWAMGIDDSNSNYFSIANNSTLGTNDRLVIDTSGNVGIGTTGPGYKLDIAGDTAIRSGNHLWLFNPVNDAATAIYNTASTGTGNITFRTGGVDNVVINNSGNVGIGTTGPGSKLHVSGGSLRIGDLDNVVGNRLIIDVSGNIEHTYGLNDGSATTNYGRFSISNNIDGTVETGNNSGGIKLRNNAGAWSAITGGSASVGSLKFWTGGTSTNQVYDALSAAVAMTILPGGNVGIGTVPGNKLVVYNNDTGTPSTAGMMIDQAGTGDSALTFRLTGAKAFTLGIDNSDSDKFKISDSTATGDFGTDRLVIDTGGNVGIGTTSITSGAKLDVRGSIYSSGSFYPGNGVIQTSRSFGDDGTSLTASNLKMAGTLNMNGQLITGSAAIRVNSDEWAIQNTTGNVKFRFKTSDGSLWIGGATADGTASQPLHVVGNGYFSGNVGIGTTNPQAKLDIAGTNSLISNSAGDITINAASNNISFAGDNLINILNLYASGNVGIGTSSPSSKLHVAGNITLDDAAATNYYLYTRSTTSPTNTTLYINNPGSGNANLNIEGDLTVTGNDILDAGGSPAITFDGTQNTALAGNLTMQDDKWIGLGSSAGRIVFDNQATDYVNILDSRVGIGTTAPGATLDVNGYVKVGPVTASIGGNEVYIKQPDTGTDYYYYALYAENADNTLFNAAVKAKYSGTSSTAYALEISGGSGYSIWSSSGKNYFAGNVGIGTASPGVMLDLEGGELRLNDSDNTSEIRAGAANTSTSGSLFLSARDGDEMFRFWTDSAIAQFNTNESGAWSSAAFDYAEKFPFKNLDVIQKGDLVSVVSESDQVEVLDRASTPYDHRLTGIVSTQAGFIGGIPWDENSIESPNLDNAVSLVGRVPVKASTLNGSIKIGDRITTSNLPGVGMKATKAGVVAGHALQEFNPNPATCKPVNALQEISWAEFPSGTNHIEYTKECFRLPDGVLVGKIIVFVNIGWHDPDVYLTDTGDLQIAKSEALSTKSETDSTSSPQASPNDQNSKFQIVNAAGEIIERIGTFSEAVIANLRTGLIQTQELFAEKKIVSPLIETQEIKTDRISLKDIEAKPGEDLVINLTQKNAEENAEGRENGFGRLIVKGKEGKEVMSIDAEGNVYTEGDITARSATFAGELRAKKIIAEEIVGLKGKFGELLASTSSATYITQNITNITQIIEATPLPTPSPTPSISPEPSATESGEIDALADIELSPDIEALVNEILNTSSEATPQATLAYTEGEDLNIINSLTVLGATSLADTSIAGSLNIGGTMNLSDNSINSLTGPLYLQNLGLGGIDIFGGKIVMDTNGNITTTGTISAGGLVLTQNNAKENAEQRGSGFGKLLTVINKEGIEVASIDASGSAFFAKLGIEADYSATQSGAIIAAYNNWKENRSFAPAIKTNATAGIGIMPAGETEIQIYNPNITDQSLIYVVPSSDTENKVLYVKAKKAQKNAEFDAEGREITLEEKGWFKVAIDVSIKKDIQFNWWIIGGQAQ